MEELHSTKRASSPSSLKEETSATKRMPLTTSTGTLTQCLSSKPPVKAPPLPTLLPFDLVLEILYRLPVKSLLQFRCVCKYWNSLISEDADFAEKHLRASIARHRYRLIVAPRNSSSTELVFFDSSIPSVTSPVCNTTTSFTLKCPPPPIPKYCGFGLGWGISSCDGIICYAVNESSALLFNPSIRKFKLLPPLETLDIPRERVYRTSYILGYHRFTKTYKIVAVSLLSTKTNYVSVHTLGTDFWRKIDEDFPSDAYIDGPGIFVSDTVNWLTHDVLRSSWVIISLDLDKESYNKLLCYEMMNESILALGVLRGCFCILSSSATSIGVWLMKEYGNEESWTKLFTLPKLCGRLFREGIGYFLYIKVLYISEDDQELLLEIVMPDREKKLNLVLYDSRNGTFKIPEIQNINDLMTSQACIDSLISPFS